MARPLIVEPGTERLHVMLMRDCATIDVTNVTLTVSRKGESMCPPVLDCADACTPPYSRAHDTAEGRWGACSNRSEPNCAVCCKHAPPLGAHEICDKASYVLSPPASKTYFAQTVVRGVATFVVDHDLIDAPAGWYLGLVAINGCELTGITIWVRRCEAVGRAVKR